MVEFIYLFPLLFFFSFHPQRTSLSHVKSLAYGARLQIRNLSFIQNYFYSNQMPISCYAENEYAIQKWYRKLSFELVSEISFSTMKLYLSSLVNRCKMPLQNHECPITHFESLLLGTLAILAGAFCPGRISPRPPLIIGAPSNIFGFSSYSSSVESLSELLALSFRLLRSLLSSLLGSLSPRSDLSLLCFSWRSLLDLLLASRFSASSASSRAALTLVSFYRNGLVASPAHL